MEDSSLQERLRDHAKAFDGLLSLIPSKMYYGEATSDQWGQKKRTKEQVAAARRGRLDPDSALNRNAKEVMDDRARNKRKLQEMQEDEEEDDDDDDNGGSDSPVEGIEQEKPLEGLKTRKEKDSESSEPKKRQKVSGHNDAELDEKKETNLAGKAEKEALRKRKQNEKAERKRVKEERSATMAASMEPTGEPDLTNEGKAPSNVKTLEQETKKVQRNKQGPNSQDDNVVDVAARDSHGFDDERSGSPEIKALNLPNLDHSAAEASEASTSPSAPHSPTFDSLDSQSAPPADGTASTTTSISSTVPPSEKPKHIKVPADTTALRARLAAKIAQLRAARKADGPDGKPVRTRQELIEQRRAKEAQRKANKKELRRQAKLEEERKREEALALNSPMSPALELDESAANFSFGRVAFGDGTRLSRDLGHVLNNDKKKGPSDPKTALLKLQNEKKRVAGLDKEKKQEVQEKETWLKARQRAEGEKIHDDEGLLKKAVKRKEKSKKKTEREWKERVKGVELAQKERQKKRTENIKKRKEDKIMRKIGKKNKKKARPGFEGSLGLGRRKQK